MTAQAIHEMALALEAGDIDGMTKVMNTLMPMRSNYILYIVEQVKAHVCRLAA